MTKRAHELGATNATFKNATVVAAYEEAAGLLGVDPSIAAGTAAFLPSLITEAGSTQDELSDNASNAARLAMALADRGRTDAAAAQADADQALAAGDLTASLSQVVGTTYLKVGHGGGVDHDEGAFACDTDLQFPDGLDIRVWGRLIRSAGADSFAEWVTRNVDGLVGSVDGYELAPWEDEDGDLRWFAEHIKVGETVELNPRPISAKGLPQNPAFGLISGIRHTIDYTGGPGGVGVEKLWVPSGDPDEVTADGVGWRIITELVHEDPESMNLGYTEPFMLGMSKHESHLFVVQMFNGIDGTCLVDLHASDATSATEVTCRQGTRWTAAGSQGEIVGYAQAGTDASALTTGTVAFARLPIGSTSTTVPAGNDARFSDARTPTAHKTSHATGGSDAIAPSDIGAVSTSRTIAGLDLSADRSASTLAAALPVWQTIANVTLGSASGSQSFNVTGYRAVQVTFIGRSNRTSAIIDSIRLRFNSDTGSNYSVNAGAFTTTAQVFDIPSENTNTDRSSLVVIRYGYMAGAQLAGTATGEAPSSTATTAANVVNNGFIWKGAVSTAPTSLEIYTAVGQFSAGSSFLVEGRV